MKSLCGLALFIAIFSSGLTACQKLQDPAFVNAGANIDKNSAFPHTKDWNDGHITHVVKSNASHSSVRNCTVCHQNLTPTQVLNISCGLNCHGTQTPGQAVKPGLSKPPVVSESDCTLCHGTKATLPIVHGPVAEKDGCTNCHNPHNGRHDEPLVASEPELCLMCHESAMTASDGREIPNIREKIEASGSVHAVAAECSACHSPHSSNHKRLLTSKFERRLRAEYPAGTASDQVFTLCFECHDTRLLDSQINADSTAFRKDTWKDGKILRKNLHRVHVYYSQAGEKKVAFRSCRICHDPHGSELPAMLGSNVQGFIRSETGGNCTRSCHGTSAERGKIYQRLD